MKIRPLILILINLFSFKLYAGLELTQAIYGKDEREFITKSSVKKFKDLGSSVALIISKDSVTNKWMNSQVHASTLEAYIGLCKDEKHSQLPSLNNCTGFIVGEDLLLSAGHCFQYEEQCLNNFIIFDVTRDRVNNQGYKISKSSIYSCKQILVSSTESDLDFSLIRLDRKVTNRNILKLHQAELNFNVSNYVYMIGHPLGLPLMKTSVEVLMNSEFDTVYKVALDSFLGNSGSPVIHSVSQKVVGILVNGNEDFQLDEINKCERYKRFNSIGNEGVLSIQKILPLVKSYLY